MATARTVTLLLLALTSCATNSDPRSDAQAKPVSSSEKAREQGEASEQDADPKKTDPDDDCARIGPSKRHKLGCPFEYGEDAWGDVNRTATEMAIYVSRNVKDCFRSFGDHGTSDYFPPLDKPCAKAPDKKCVLVDDATPLEKPWEFRAPQKGSIWYAVGYPKTYPFEGTRSTHIRIGWDAREGRCEFWFEGIADLDEDGYPAKYLIGWELTDDGIGDITRQELQGEMPSLKRAKQIQLEAESRGGEPDEPPKLP